MCHKTLASSESSFQMLIHHKEKEIFLGILNLIFFASSIYQTWSPLGTTVKLRSLTLYLWKNYTPNKEVLNKDNDAVNWKKKPFKKDEKCFLFHRKRFFRSQDI